MLIRKIGLFVLSFCFCLSSCSKIDANATHDILFKSLYPDCSWNSELIFLPQQPDDKFGDEINLNYRNTSDKVIAFPPDSGVQIYYLDLSDSAWIELRNNLEYAAAGPYIFEYPGSPDDLVSYGSLGIILDFSEIKPKEIRVAIKGYTFLDGEVTNNCVGAYTDIIP